MVDRGNLRWEEDSYTEDQVAAVLHGIGLDSETETEAVFLLYCPFHGNVDTPSFAVNKTDGTYICFNPACNQTGGLMRLIKTVGKLDDFQAKRLIARAKLHKADLVQQLEKVTESNDLWVPYRHSKRPNYMAEIKRDMWRFAEPQLYMRNRGFDKKTLKEFEIGYDTDLDMVCVPMHDLMGKVEVGAVRRSIKEKVFKNTPGLPTSKTAFNIHRAKKIGDTCVIVEASFSAMRLTQVGYPNVVALLMGHFSEEHARLLGRYFNTIVIMTDYDDKKKNVYKSCPKCRKAGSNLCKGHNPGEELGAKIANMMSYKRILWAHCGEATRFPPGIKDPDDMDDEMIRSCIQNAVGSFEYALDL